jgi:hypothetical protein
MAIKVIGLDLAKNVFQVHGIDETGRTAFLSPARAASWRAGSPRR